MERHLRAVRIRPGRVGASSRRARGAATGSGAARRGVVAKSAHVGVGEHAQVFDEFRNALESFQQARDHFNLVQELKADVVKSQQAEGENQESEESGDEG